MRSIFLFSAACILGASLSPIDASAQEAACRANYHFMWGQDSQGSISNDGAAACRLQIRLGGRSSMSSVEIVKQPSNGTASPAGASSLVFKPKPGFKGSDSMVVRFSGTGPSGPGTSTVTFALTVN